jgi:methionyl-tRNA formyltransferase
VPLHRVRNINDEGALALLDELALDLAFVIGWTQLVRAPARQRVARGMIGAHASLLPALRGRAPVNWALIRGLTETGNTLFWLEDAADRGDIIDQSRIPISPYDTCASIYGKVGASTARMILDALPTLLAGGRPGRRQPAALGPDLPARRPEDGLVHWNQPARAIYDAVRALTRPYPGAFSWLDGRRYRIWNAAVLPDAVSVPVPAGTILGPVRSPRAGACGVAVACRPGVVVLLEIEGDEGTVVRGRALSELPWAGAAWRESA